MQAADRAVEEPLVLLLGKKLQLFLVLLALRLQLTFRKSFAADPVRTVYGRILRGGTLGILFEACKLLFVQDTLHFALFETLFAGKPARFMALPLC